MYVPHDKHHKVSSFLKSRRKQYENDSHFMMLYHTPNANMADHSVGARDESNGSEASEDLMFFFENPSPENFCFVVDLFRFISLCLQVAVFLNATRRERNLPPFTSKGK